MNNGFLREELQDVNVKDSNDTQLFIHLIAHSHDDVGWLKTVDGYFSGTNFEKFDNFFFFTELLKDPNRRYT